MKLTVAKFNELTNDKLNFRPEYLITRVKQWAGRDYIVEVAHFDGYTYQDIGEVRLILSKKDIESLLTYEQEALDGTKD